MTANHHPTPADTATARAVVFDSLYIDDNDLTHGDDTDLRDLGLDSIRLTRILRDLGLATGPHILPEITACPSITTIAAGLAASREDNSTDG
ncbi:acyl carrier protein [Corynebacterium kroppenstedtii]|uniref:acyl carrier protein n=1 Tax=Corynebacterium sp. PCR 32 TaxID=3351342 RepID=UPI00309BA2E2